MSIVFDNFTFKYWALEKPTLKNINLTINKGEKIVIVGPSGSGKSTLGQCLNGLIPHAIKGDCSGTLTINGQDTQKLKLDDCTSMVGTVLQDTDGQFVGLSVGEDIAFVLENQMIEQKEMHNIVQATADMMDLTSIIDLSPFDLSGGQKQRVSLAGVMVDDVEILLFDEPLASLDPKTGKAAIEIIDDLHQKTGKTVIIIEHRLEDVLHRPVDRIIMMERGEIVADLTPNQLLASSLLTEHGIREPLYLTALKEAGCDITEQDNPAYFNQMPLEKFKPQVEHWFTQAKLPEHQTSQEVLLSLNNLAYSYDGERQTLQNVSFDVHKGEFVAVLGKNGSGKSTLTRLIMGVLEPDQGTICLNGEDLTNSTIFERSQRIGVVMQNPNHMISHHMIFDEVASGLRNRGMAEEIVEEKVYAMLELCGLGRYRDWPIDALSYGQKKRVTIATILVLEPELLILDEPTAGQDYHHYTMMMEFVKELNQKLGITIMIVSHDMHLVLEYTDRAVVICDSELLADEAVNSVFSQPELLDKANLTVTSLYSLAQAMGIERIDNFIRCFIEHEARTKQ
ncbi:energy-coupling factor ABC transporter ATP-binding protein [Photobacterium damselae subsp. piscicida]|uniref:Energy-coupling factor ABC transporter ATP-binding protein n=1 Tax=Photobacterium damsela subsp. piscicida TaxID=38294 RepID=A0A1Q9H5V7_PHODP|nr:ABC transporter ATP-binding protein [Photobacterium damselae]MBE8129055.1 energy-coupling factor ABC transporter ATP-binding protein [Photobacterium damselae subsp. piscicida]NVH46552.1 energy-coupling factor ABC transporter ATP-binding protein [Photobacterium damselae subsp. damselae]OLQ83116.1 heme ABC transporter ATP-binding protein [Photobacterium damselae subsp. piscicida]PSV72021.1 heme ABC transporter ATP-binding protein [Photobacterium damselae]PSW77521.1 heme ABC transporter ATP-bi